MHILALVCLLVTLYQTSPALTLELTHSTVPRDYRVYGNTPKDLVRYMRVRPFRGDNGPTVANIRPKYSLKLDTRRSAGRCSVGSVKLDIRFTMTLPRAMNSSRFDPNTRYAWRAFRAFLQRHETYHRRVYIRCARRFMRDARRIAPNRSCSRIVREANRQLRAADRACNRLHDAFDRREAGPLYSQRLFRLASVRQSRSTSVRFISVNTNTWNTASQEIYR